MNISFDSLFYASIQATFVVLALPFVIFSYEQNVNLSAVPLYASYVKFSTVASHPSFVILSRLNDDDDCVMFPGNNREVSSINVLAGRSQLGLFGDIV